MACKLSSTAIRSALGSQLAVSCADPPEQRGRPKRTPPAWLRGRPSSDQSHGFGPLATGSVRTSLNRWLLGAPLCALGIVGLSAPRSVLMRLPPLYTKESQR